MLDRFRCYELAVTNAPMLARFCAAAHGGRARMLREDFSGTAALARAWLGLDARHRAVAVDVEARVLARARREAAGMGRPFGARLGTVVGDACAARERADIIAATNFPLGYFPARTDLLAYLRHARACLRTRGVLVADMYGGVGAFTPGTTRVRVRAPEGGAFTYLWEQRRADPLTGLVENAIHFEIPTRRSPRARSASEGDSPAPRVRTIRDAFTYHWRLWTIPELVEAMDEAGFRAVEVHDRLGGAIDSDGRLHLDPLHPGDALDSDWVVYFVARR